MGFFISQLLEGTAIGSPLLIWLSHAATKWPPPSPAANWILSAAEDQLGFECYGRSRLCDARVQNKPKSRGAFPC